MSIYSWANKNGHVNFSTQINVNLLSIYSWANKNGHVYFSNQVNNNLPSIGILLSQTFNWYLIAGQVPGSIQKRTTCTCLYACASGQTASSIEQFVPSLCFVIGQTASSIEQFVSSSCSIISQTASSI
jgi:hypothetical protein